MGYGAEDGPEPERNPKPYIRFSLSESPAVPIDGLCPTCGSSRRGSRVFASNLAFLGKHEAVGWECTSCDTFGFDRLDHGPIVQT